MLFYDPLFSIEYSHYNSNMTITDHVATHASLWVGIVGFILGLLPQIVEWVMCVTKPFIEIFFFKTKKLLSI